MEDKHDQEKIGRGVKELTIQKSNRLKPEARDGIPWRFPVRWILLFGVLGALLGGAAFTAGHLLGRDLPPLETKGQEMVKSEDGSITGSGVRLLPDKRLPDQPPIASGQFNQLKDNCLFIHQFPESGMVFLDKIDEYPMVEILITRDTLIYKDVTDLSNTNQGGVAQQVVVVGTIEEITKGSSIVVWGEKRGERILAEVIQYF
jgi:hypothetical protein